MYRQADGVPEFTQAPAETPLGDLDQLTADLEAHNEERVAGLLVDMRADAVRFLGGERYEPTERPRSAAHEALDEKLWTQKHPRSRLVAERPAPRHIATVINRWALDQMGDR